MPSIPGSLTPASGSLGRAYIEGVTPINPGTISARTISDVNAAVNGLTISGSITFTFRAFKGTQLDKTWTVTYRFRGTRL